MKKKPGQSVRFMAVSSRPKFQTPTVQQEIKSRPSTAKGTQSLQDVILHR